MFIFLVCGIVGILIGILLEFLVVFSKNHFKDMQKRCIKLVEGKFVKLVENKSLNLSSEYSRYEIYYYPIYEFYVDEKRYEVQSRYGHRKNDKSLVDKKKIIYYNPNDISECYIKGENLKKAYLAIKILGIILVGIGVFDIVLFFIIKSII